VIELVVHELAHVYQHASQRATFDTPIECEADADHLQQQSGFWFGPSGHVSWNDATNVRSVERELDKADGLKAMRGKER
jgi:hypothetical protein